MVVRRVHQHLDMGLKIRRVPVQNMILLLHVDAGLVGSQGGHICGVTDQSLLDGKSAPWSPLAWRSFKLSRTVPSSLGAEAQAMSVVLGFVEWAKLFLQELIHGLFDLRGAPAVMQERPPVCVTDCTSQNDHLLAVGSPTTLRQEVCHRCAHYSKVLEEDGLCDTLDTYAIGRWAHEGQGRGS